jgi:hypothetical protein
LTFSDAEGGVLATLLKATIGAAEAGLFANFPCLVGLA